MTTTLLDLADIQGGILRAYGLQGFPKARYFFLNIRNAAEGRKFVEALRPKICTAAKWKDPDRAEPLQRTRNPRVKDIVRAEGFDDYPGTTQLLKPYVAINIAFTFSGLLALEVPTRTLRGMPDPFMDGMEVRASILGDDPFLDTRDAIWKNSKGENRVHIMVSMNARMDKDGTSTSDLEYETKQLQELCKKSKGGVVLLPGNGPDGALWQEMSAVMHDDPAGPQPSNKEHFGLSDGFGDPVFEGQLPPRLEELRKIGGGKLLPDRSWVPIATGEFLLGYPDEAQEIPGAAMPIEFSRNGTFMAYRKLHESVASFDKCIAEQGAKYAAMFGVSQSQGEETVKAKMVGRWSDGVPLMAAPTYAAWTAFKAELAKAHEDDDKPKLAQIALKYTNFTYRPDVPGAQCPMTSHLRRANPRDSLDPHFGSPDPKSGDGSALVNRRRILRRGLPYGKYDRTQPSDHGEHGIIFLAICADLFRQFEFVQQQWIQYGLDFNAGSDTCPIIGNHPTDDHPKQIVVADATQPGARPFVTTNIPQLVEPRGGDYFFIPSMTALRMIGMGIVDPT